MAKRPSNFEARFSLSTTELIPIEVPVPYWPFTRQQSILKVKVPLYVCVTSAGLREIHIVVMGDTIEKVSKSSILTKVSILAKSIGNSIPLEPAMFLSVFLTNRLILHEGKRLKAKNVDMMLFLNKNM
jgi:hypothetical protein